MLQALKNIAAPFAAMLVGYASLMYANYQEYAVPEEAQLAIWLMAPAMAGVTVWRNNTGGSN